MLNVVYQKQEYIIIQKPHGYIVVNKNGEYKNHSHFSYSLKGAKDCINFTLKKIVPKKSRYMAIACRRISLDMGYISTIDEHLSQEKKRRYINYNYRR